VKHTGVVAALPADAADRLQIYAAALRHWNGRINLVSRADAADLWHRHIADCAQLAALLPDVPGDIVDLGSGAGLPGLVLAIVADRHVRLVESDQRKAAFLREAARLTGASVTVHAVRAQALQVPPAAVVTARALAPLPALLPLAHRLLRPDGYGLFPKGRAAEDELTAAANGWHMRVERFASQTDAAATILRISELRPVATAA